MVQLEYRVRPVPRFIVTSFRTDGKLAGSQCCGEFDNEETAFSVAYALCKAEHDRLGWDIGDERIRYPARPSEATATPCDEEAPQCQSTPS